MRLIVAQLGCLDHYVSREFAIIIRELIDTYGWKYMEYAELWDDPRPWRDLIRRKVDELPEVILFWEGMAWSIATRGQIHALDCKKVIFADDLHYRDESVRWSKLLAYLVCDVVISTYAHRFEAFYPEVYNLKRVVWSPHSAAPEFLLPFNEQADNAVFLSGAINSYYPMRQMMCELSEAGTIASFATPSRISLRLHHGHDPAVGPGYARAINGYRTAFTDGSIHRYTVAKFFEIPATGALLWPMRRYASPCAVWGSSKGEHYVSASAEDLADRVREVLDESNTRGSTRSGGGDRSSSGAGTRRAIGPAHQRRLPARGMTR